jgi:shikimate kinase
VTDSKARAAPLDARQRAAHDVPVEDDLLPARHAVAEDDRTEHLRALLGTRCIVLVGMMGAGKSSIGRRLANSLHLPFLDADAEIEKAANLTVPEIFEHYGEAHFREGEERVIARLLAGGPAVIATGGGAYMSAETRERCRTAGITVWLKADVPLMLERVRKRGNRPLLKGSDPERRMRELLSEREPVYALADIMIASREGPHQAVVSDVLAALDSYLAREGTP